MSDLQCPARLLLLTSVEDTTAASLRHERVARVYDGRPDEAAVAEPPLAAVGSALGRALGVPVHRLDGSVDLDAVTAHDAAALRLLHDLGDLHRGETVVVLAGGRRAARREVHIDGDGVLLNRLLPEAAT